MPKPKMPVMSSPMAATMPARLPSWTARFDQNLRTELLRRSRGGRATVPVHVAKTHLDLGFTALAAEVESRYLTDFFPRAVATAEALAARGDERLVWTTGSWILHRALHDVDRDRAAAVDAAVRAGHLASHALPLTFHTELMDAPLVRSALGISAELDERFGTTTTAAKMTDVPGHTRGLVPLLAEAGVTFLHLGVNPAWPVPDVPPTFRWRSPDGAELVVAYQAGGYGGEVAVAGCEHVLAFLHAGDNLGPPTAEEVRAAHGELAARHPGAEVRASTLDAFARALAASGAAAALPVVTAEIGDPWLFGAGSDPQKLASFREVLGWRNRFAAHLGARTVAEVDRRLLLVAEHTWGLDQKEVLPVERPWDAAALGELRHSAAGRRFERSWAEQRQHLEDGVALLRGALRADPPPGSTGAAGFARTLSDRALEVPAWPTEADGRPVGGFEPLAADGLVPAALASASWDVAVDPATGALRRARHRASGRDLADDDHLLGVLTHQTFDEADYERFYAQLRPSAEDEWWARRDNTKPGIDAAGARSRRRPADEVRAWGWLDPGDALDLFVRLRFSGDDAERVGAPAEAWLRWRFQPDVVEASLWWRDKVATRLPEATWLSFTPIVAEPERWLLDKLGQDVSPLDVVRGGGRSLHAVGERGLRYDGPDGALALRTPDAPLVAPGRPNLLDADPPLPDLAGGFHVLLHDNCWGTNFPMWNEGPAAFSFELDLG